MVRNAELAPLVGTGISLRAGLPDWIQLITRMVLAWREWDPSDVARRLSQGNYAGLVDQAFGFSNLATVSYLRSRIDAAGDSGAFQGLGQLLYSALYSRQRRSEDLFTPDPDHVHRHLVALFAQRPRRLWTTNYDDLLEEAARRAGIPVRTLDPDRRQVNNDLLVAHLHGFLAPPDRSAGNPKPGQATVVLAEDDYHAIAADLIGWTNRELYRLFDEHRVLVLGMSLADPNLRRVLATVPCDKTGLQPRHFALMRSITEEDMKLWRTRATTRKSSAAWVNESRSWYWQRHGIEIVEIPDYDSILPFLVRLRYESFGGQPGDLWRRGAELGYESVDPWRADRQKMASWFLADAVRALADDFSVSDPAEVIEIGVFLLKPDAATLELTFRGGGTDIASQGATLFSGDPDKPTGVAGRVFVSGDLVRVTPDHSLYNYGLDPSNAPLPQNVKGIISAPITDWHEGGIPLGVVYVTTSTGNGTLFRLRPRVEVEPSERSLDDLYAWLSEVGMTLISGFRVRAR